MENFRNPALDAEVGSDLSGRGDLAVGAVGSVAPSLSLLASSDSRHVAAASTSWSFVRTTIAL